MALKTCTRPAGSVGAYAKIEIRLSQDTIITSGGLNYLASPIEVTAASDGSYSVQLQANGDLTPTGTFYSVTEFAGTTDFTYYIQVPSSAGPFVITTIQVSPLPTVAASPNHVSTLTVDSLATLGTETDPTPGWSIIPATATRTTIQGKLDVIGPGGGELDLGPGSISIDTGLVMNYNNVHLKGRGFSTLLVPTSAVTTSVISTTQPASDVRHGVAITDLKIDCSAMTSGDGIDLMGTYYADIRNVWIKTPPTIGLYVDRAVGSTLPPAYNEFRNVHITNGKSIGIQIGGGANSGADFNKFIGCTVEFCGGGGSGNTNGIGLNGLGNFDQFIGCIWDANDTNIVLNSVRGYRFDHCTVDRAYKNLISISGGDNHRFTQLKGGDFVSGVLANQSQSGVVLTGGTQNNFFDGFLFDSNSTLWLYAIREFSGAGPNFYSGLDMKGIPMNLWIKAVVMPNCIFDTTNKPTIANGPAVGSSPPAATVLGTNFRGRVSLGTGTATTTGRLCTVSFSSANLMGPFSAGPGGGTPYVSLTAASSGATVKTANLGLSVQNALGGSGFDIFCETAPTVSQAAGTYLINYAVDWATSN